MNLLKRLRRRFADELVLFAIIAIFFIVMSIASPFFLKTRNLMNILQNISLQGITAIGMTMVIIAGAIDLSVGAVLALSAWVAAYIMKADIGWPVAVLAALAIAALFGMLNGFTVSVIKIPPMIATLASMNMARGLQTVISQGRTLNGFPESFQFFGQGMIFGFIPMPALITVLLYILGSFFMKRTTIGRSIYAVGGNKDASRIAGINNTRIMFFVYVMAALLTCISGLVFIARLDSAPAALAKELEMKAIMGAVIGGTSVTFGGKGKLFGTFLGVIVVGLIINAMDLLGLNAYYQQFVQGLLVLIAVALEALRDRYAEKKN